MTFALLLGLSLAATSAPKASPTRLTEAEVAGVQRLAGSDFEVSAEQAFRVTLEDWGEVSVAIACF
jgi:hypothetical protein